MQTRRTAFGSMDRPGLARVGALAALVAISGVALAPSAARACGCFAPPDPANPIVQAGERIVFAAYAGQVTAIIQIQYQGDAKDFGWLLPLPSVPTLETSSDEVFASLTAATAPDYVTKVVWNGQNCFQGGAGGGAGDLGEAAAYDGGANGGGGPSDPLVYQSSVGPYDFAVLKADDKTAMLAWLANNHYFVPAGTDGVLGPYLHAGAYFLALKLKSGQSAGDLQPVIVRYASDLPMIPITLTSVTASPGMNVWAWVLGEARAIPRNYYHVVLDDAALQWPYYGDSVPFNYGDVVQKAVQSAPEHHAFTTELAQPMKKIADQIFAPGRYGDPNELQKITDAGQYLDYLKSHGYTFSSQLVTILQKYIPIPANLQDRFGRPASPANYYYNFDYWRVNYPQYFQGFNLSFDAVALTAELQMKIVQPMKDAETLFTGFPYLTRLYTRLDPEDMNRDPVFSFNPFLPDVAARHESTLTMGCDGSGMVSSTLQTEQGFTLGTKNYWGPPTPDPRLPAALRIEILREAGAPEVVQDNEGQIRMLLGEPPPPDAAMSSPTDGGASSGPTLSAGGSGGCSIPGEGGARGGLAVLLFASIAAIAIGRARRRR